MRKSIIVRVRRLMDLEGGEQEDCYNYKSKLMEVLNLEKLLLLPIFIIPLVVMQPVMKN